MDLTRKTPPALLAALSGPVFYPVVLADVDWPGARVLAHSNAGPITWGGRTFQGVGKFGAIDVGQETMSGVPEEFSMALTCELAELAEYAETLIRGRDGAIYLGATETRGGSDLIGAVEIIAGTCDGLVLRSEVVGASGETVILYTLTVGFSTGPSYRSMAALSHSDADQRRSFPNDTAGRHLLAAQANAEKTLWPEP